MPTAAATTSSFRDPDGRVILHRGRVFRVLGSEAWARLNAFLATEAAQAFLHSGELAKTSPVADDACPPEIADAMAPDEQVVEHEAVWFPSYPYEWAPEMLHAAAGLTLRLASQILEAGAGLKDATPYNVLFDGPRPVFVDLLSFESRNPADPTWLAAAQLERTFLLPLLLNRLHGVPLAEMLLGNRDGIEPETARRLIRGWRALASPALQLVTVPALLSRAKPDERTGFYSQRSLSDPAKARFILESTLHRYSRMLAKLEPAAGQTSSWSAYMNGGNTYSDRQLEQKEAFVARALARTRPRTVLDIGCNTGHFSLLSARTAGARTVSIDSDPVVVGRVWRAAREADLPILPLVQNLARPTPAVGWRNRECPSFLSRAAGQFDLVLMLAVVHHLAVTERVPIEEIVSLAAELTRSTAVIEFVSPEDPMFQRLTRGRDALHAGLTRNVFEHACAREFRILRCEQVAGSARWLYHLERSA